MKNRGTVNKRYVYLLTIVALPVALAALTYRPLGGYQYAALPVLKSNCVAAIHDQITENFSDKDFYIYDVDYAGPTRTGAPGNRARSFQFEITLADTVTKGSCFSEPPGVQITFDN